MRCLELHDTLDDYIDGRLPAGDVAALDEHVRECSNCQRLTTRERELRDLLQSYGESAVPQPDTAFFDAALRRAASEGRVEARNRWLMTGFAGVIAATVAIWITSGTLLTSPAPAVQMAEISMTLEQPRTVNLVFSAENELRDATLTLLLPAGVELAGFAGRQQVSWRTDLNKGRNVLPLTLIGHSQVEGELQAVLKHKDDDREFRVRVRVI
jgi:anti-sigma factor RsiW